MSDTSLVFNLVARDRASQTLETVKGKFDAAATGIAAGVAGALGVGVAQALDMSAANAKLAAQLGVGPAEAAELSKVSADVYADAWGDSATTVNEAIKGVYQNIGDTSGIEGGLEGATEDVLALSEAFDVDLAMSTKTVGQLMKTGLAKDAGEAMDMITWGMQNGLNASDDFLDTLNEYAPQFQKLGLDGQSSLGLLNAMMQAGVRDSDAAADAIKEFGLRAIDTSTAVTQAYQGIGLDADEMRAKIAAGGPGAAKAMGQVWEALKRVQDPIKQNQLGTALMGTQWEDTVRSILPNLDTTKLGIEGVEGATDKMSDTLAKSPAKSLERFKREATTKLAEVAGGFISFAADNAGVFEPLAYTLAGLAGAVLVIKAGMVVWTAAQAAWSAATAIATAVQWAWNASLWGFPLVWIIAAIIAVVAIIVLIATKTTWFQQIWSAVWGFITSFVQGQVNVIMSVIGWFAQLPGKFAGWFGAAKDWAVSKFTALVTWLAGLPGRALAAINNLNLYIGNKAIQAGNALKDALINRALSLLGWLGGLGGRAVRAVGNFHSLLYNKGVDVITGLWNGISSMGGWLWGRVTSFVRSNVVDAAKSFLHIGSPSRLMADQIGRWVPAGVALGIEQNQPVVDKAMRNMIQPEAYRPAQSAVGIAPAAGAAAATAGRVPQLTARWVNGGGDRFLDWLQERIRIEYGGDVTNLNTGR